MRRLIIVVLVLAFALAAVPVAQAWTLPDSQGTDTLTGPTIPQPLA